MAKVKIEVGESAPLFNSFDQNGEEISLSKFKNKNIVLLYFYPKAMTPGCTVQACSLRDYEKDLNKLKIKVVGVSPDSVSRLKKFEQKENLNFTLISDEDHKIASSYGVYQKKMNYGKEYMGILRTSFIIGKDGKIKHIMEKVNTKTHHQDVVDWVKENL